MPMRSIASALRRRRDEAALEIGGARPRRAFARLAPTAAATRLDHQAVAWPDHQAGLLGADRPRRLAVGVQDVTVRRAVGAAQDAAGAVAHAVAGGVAERRLGDFRHDLEHPARAAPILAVAARVRAELMAREVQRETDPGD